MTDKATFNLSDFQSFMSQYGPALSDRFEIFISLPKCLEGSDYRVADTASLLADTVSFPPMTITNKRQQIYGTSSPRPMSIDYGGEDLTITFVLDTNMLIKDMFDYWLQSIIDVDNQLVAYQDDYTCSIEIRQLDKANNIVYQCTIDDAYPYRQGTLTASHSAANSVHRLPVSFAYKKWTNIGLPSFGTNATQTVRDTNVGVTVL